jgi:hypothetical protein
MRRRIPDMGTADMPARRLSFWRMTGPGAVLVGLSIGAGEIVLWPWVTAKFGAVMVWAAALGIFIQLWVNLEIGRWAIATGEAPYTGFGRFWIGIVWALIAIGFLGIFLPGWARISGAALRVLVFGTDGPGPDWMWTAVTFAGCGLVVFGPKVMYDAVEKVVSLLVLALTLGMIYVAFAVGSWEALLEMGRGLLNFGHVELDDEFTFARFFGAVVFAGAGGAGNLWYAFYLRDKGIGMGARIPKLTNPLRDAPAEQSDVGFTYEDTPENARRFRDWFRWVVNDQVLYFWLLNTFTLFLFVFGALCVLHPAGIVPEEGQLLWDEAEILAGAMGPPGRVLFLLIGMSALFSTQIVIVDGSARAWAYILQTVLRIGRGIPQGRFYLPLALLFMVAGVLATWILDFYDVTGLGFLFNSALLGGFSMAIYVPTMLVINLRTLPRSARPRPLNVAMMIVASSLYVGFALYTLWNAVS